MNAIMVTEVVANEGQNCAFTGRNETLGVARKLDDGIWLLKLADGQHCRCEDFDEMRERILRQLQGRRACFERRRIHSRRHHRSTGAMDQFSA